MASREVVRVVRRGVVRFGLARRAYERTGVGLCVGVMMFEGLLAKKAGCGALGWGRG